MGRPRLRLVGGNRQNAKMVVWGLVISAIGALFVFWGRTHSDNRVYRLLGARARWLWRGQVHGFFQVSGVMMFVFGIALAVS